MASLEELMLIFRAKDEVSSVAGQIDDSVQGMAASAQSALASMTSGMASLSTVSDSLIGSLNSGKSASDIIFGNASKAETNKVLINNMTSTKEAAEDLYDTVDKVTDSSLTSMQDLIPALNAFKAATGASDDEVKDITDDMANFGAAVLAQTGSTALAETAMMSLSKGIKGAFASLDQYGVSEDALKRTGLWSGEEDDIRGFMAAVTEVMGSTKELMETNQGLDALIQKAFSRGGKKIGHEFLPIIKDVKRGFLDLDNALGGNLTAIILLVGEGIDVMNSALFNVSTAVRGVKDLSKGVKKLRNWIKGAGDVAGVAHDAADAVNDMTNAMSSVSNAGEIGANVTGMGAAGAGVASAGKTVGKGEKAVEAGTDALFAADLLKGSKSENKDLAKYLKELEKSDDTFEKIAEINAQTNERLTKKRITDLGYDPETIFGKKSTEGLSEALKEGGHFLDDDLIKEWEAAEEAAEMTFTGAIKNKFSGFKTKLTDAFSSIKNFDLKGKLTAPFTKIASSVKGFSVGESLQNALEKGFGGLGDITRGISGKLSSFGESIRNIKMPDIKGKLNGLNKSLYQSISGFSFKDTFSGLKDKLSGLRGATDAASEMKTVVSGVEEVGEVAAGVGAAAPAMEAGAAGAETAAVATTSLSAAFTSMIVPALALSAVIMIMIPVISVIAAEAMVFIKLLGEFMESLNFNNINLKGSIEGIKQIAEALLYVGAAMAAMTFTSIMTGIAAMIGGFTGITGPLKVAVSSLKEAAAQLKSFETVTIDPSVATNLQTISDSLSSVSNAMMGLTSVTVTTGFGNFIAWAFQFGDITSALEQAKDDIMQASTKLNEFSGLTPLDTSVAQNIQNVCDSLASVGDAMGALRSIRDGQNWDSMFTDLLNGLFGGVNIQEALDAVKTDIYDAATALSGWTLPEIPEGLGDKISKVSSALQSISDAFQTLRTMRDNGNWDGWMDGIFGGTDIKTALNNVITDLQDAATAIAGINVEGVDDAKIEGLGKISSAMTKISEVATTMTSMPPMEGFDSTIISTAVTNVSTVAEELAKIGDITLGEGTESVLGSIQTALSSLSETLSAAAGGFAAPAQGIGSSIVSGVTAGLSPLGSAVQGAVSSGILSASGVATSGGNTLGTNVTNAFKNSLKLGQIAKDEMNYAVQAINSGSGALADAARAAAEKAVAAAKEGSDAHSPGAIARMWGKEFGVYSPQKIYDGAGKLISAAKTISSSVVSAFGTPSLDFAMGPLNPSSLQSMDLANSRVSTPQPGNTTTIIFQEGAMPIDARDMTTKEAKQMLILALESLNLYDPNPQSTGA